MTRKNSAVSVAGTFAHLNEPTGGRLAIELSGVSKRFGELSVLDDVIMHVREGEFVAIVGPSGCGKTTLLRMLAGLECPDAGHVLWRGQPIAGPDPKRMFIFQDHALFPWRTVTANVQLGLEMAGVSRRLRERQAAEVIERVGLAGFEHYYPHQLSGGMRQRAALARGLIMEPEALLLDEPYGALDAMTRRTMQDELLQLWQGSGTTVVLITHDLDEAVYLADRLYVMQSRPGRIVTQLTLDLPRPRKRTNSEVLAMSSKVAAALAVAE